MSKVKEFFGNFTGRDDVDWKSVVSTQRCPYTDKKCVKVRKSNPDISIGICTVEYGKHGAVMICPHRMLERRQIFSDCVHLLALHEPGNELHLLSEVSVPGGSVDYFLVSAFENKVIDFVGIELQTLDTTGSLWSERSLLINGKEFDVGEADLSYKTFGMNWKMSAKTILVQMHHKIETFEHLGKHLVLVIQDCFHDYIAREFDVSRFRQARQADSFHIHSYSLDETGKNSLKLRLKSRVSTDASGVAICLGLKTEARVDLSEIVKYLEARISEETVFKMI